MTEIVSIKEFKDGCFTVTYNVWSVCMCSHVRHTIVMYSDREPTEEEVLTYISKNGNGRKKI